ncbi:MAG: GDSL-type esterase/lipase family protein [Patescibacteria group bacterium]
MNKKRILCYGDSNTWGCVPGTRFERFSEEIRFPKRLQKLLGTDFEIIEEGLYSRTLASEYDRPNKEGRNGSTYFVPCLLSHDPLDLVIIMLGTTELKAEFNNSVEEIGRYLEDYYIRVISKIKYLTRDESPELLIICPPIINESLTSKRYAGGEEKSKQLAGVYSKISNSNKCAFIDASKLMVGSDGVHMTEESHKKLAEMIAYEINKK